MSQDHSYNGWSNYETWATNLWLSNDQGTDQAAREIVAEAFASEPEYPRVAAADALKAWTEETFIDPITEAEESAGLATDLLRGAFSEVDWLEVVDAFAPETVSA